VIEKLKIQRVNGSLFQNQSGKQIEGLLKKK
jgi:hypothetical protein